MPAACTADVNGELLSALKSSMVRWFERVRTTLLSQGTRMSVYGNATSDVLSSQATAMVPVPTSVETAMPPCFNWATAPADSLVIWTVALELGSVRANTTPEARSAT